MGRRSIASIACRGGPQPGRALEGRAISAAELTERVPMASAAEQLAANINWSAFAKAEELKKRIWFTLGALVIYRLGTYIPLPGIDPAAFEAVVHSARSRACSTCSTCSRAAPCSAWRCSR